MGGGDGLAHHARMSLFVHTGDQNPHVPSHSPNATPDPSARPPGQRFPARRFPLVQSDVDPVLTTQHSIYNRPAWSLHLGAGRVGCARVGTRWRRIEQKDLGDDVG